MLRVLGVCAGDAEPCGRVPRGTHHEGRLREDGQDLRRHERHQGDLFVYLLILRLFIVHLILWLQEYSLVVGLLMLFLEKAPMSINTNFQFCFVFCYIHKSEEKQQNKTINQTN